VTDQLPARTTEPIVPSVTTSESEWSPVETPIAEAVLPQPVVLTTSIAAENVRDLAADGQGFPNTSRSIGTNGPTPGLKPVPRGRSLFDDASKPAPQSRPTGAVPVPSAISQTDLTRSQRVVFQAIASWQAAEGVSPTLAELQKATSLNRFETLNEVDALVRKGLIEFDRSAARGIRIIPEDERVPLPESFNFAVIAPPQKTSVPAAPPAMSRSSIEAVVLPISEVPPTIASATLPAKNVQPNITVPDWLESLLASELLNRQYASAGRRVPPREQLRDLLSLIANQGFAIHRETVCHTLGLPTIRYAGFLSMVMRLINIDNVPILTRDDAGDMIRLNADLLCHQFGISR